MVCAVILVFVAITAPLLTQTLRVYRASADARNIASQLAMARMLAAHKFTHARLNLTSANTYRVELQTNSGNCSTATWAPDGATQTLSASVTFGAASVGQAAPPQTGTPAQPTNNVVIFNSRGTPIDCSGAPASAYAIYLQNSSGEAFAVTVYPSSKTSVWKYNQSAWTQM